jgi:hypothetical protein
MGDEERDDWGFTPAEHEELQRLLLNYKGDFLSLWMSVNDEVTTIAHGDDPGFAGSFARMVPEGATVRVSPAGTVQRALLERLRKGAQ